MTRRQVRNHVRKALGEGFHVKAVRRNGVCMVIANKLHQHWVVLSWGKTWREASVRV